MHRIFVKLGGCRAELNLRGSSDPRGRAWNRTGEGAGEGRTPRVKRFTFYQKTQGHYRAQMDEEFNTIYFMLK